MQWIFGFGPRLTDPCTEEAAAAFKPPLRLEALKKTTKCRDKLVQNISRAPSGLDKHCQQRWKMNEISKIGIFFFPQKTSVCCENTTDQRLKFHPVQFYPGKKCNHIIRLAGSSWLRSRGEKKEKKKERGLSNLHTLSLPGPGGFAARYQRQLLLANKHTLTHTLCPRRLFLKSSHWPDDNTFFSSQKRVAPRFFFFCLNFQSRI